MRLHPPSFSAMFLKSTSQPGENRTLTVTSGCSCQSRQSVAKLAYVYAWASPAYQSHYQHSKLSTNSCLANISLWKTSRWVQTKCLHWSKNNKPIWIVYIHERNIDHELVVSRVSGCGDSVRLFVCTLPRLSHVPGQLVFGEAAGSLRPDWSCWIPEGPEEAATSQWIIFSWLCRATLRRPAVSAGIRCVTPRHLDETAIGRNRPMAGQTRFYVRRSGDVCERKNLQEKDEMRQILKLQYFSSCLRIQMV